MSFTHNCRALLFIAVISSAWTVALSVCLSLPAQAATSTPTADAAQPNAASSYTPKRGESLDHVIKMTMKDSPLRVELLRQAFVDLNPQAFVAGNYRKLRAGAALQIPDHAQLLQASLSSHAQDPQYKQRANTYPSMAGEERRRWIRYP